MFVMVQEKAVDGHVLVLVEEIGLVLVVGCDVAMGSG